MIKQSSYVLLTLLLGVSFYFGLSSYGLLNNNEGLYAEIAWETLADGNIIIPHLNGVPYIEKPPLLYWLVALSFKVFGKSVFAARVIPATFGMLTCLSLLWFGRSRKKAMGGFLGAVILASSMGFIIFSRMVFFDGILTAFLTWSLLSFYKFFEGRQKVFIRILFVMSALAALTKGLVALGLIGGVILLFLWIRGELKLLLKMMDPVAIGLFLLIFLPWHVLAALEDKNFCWFYFINEHFLRFLSKREPHDYYSGPLYYYLPRLAGYLVPWIFFVSFFIRKAYYKKDSSLQLFLCIWFVAFLLFFSASQAKANYYMVVGMPPLALWMASFLENYPHRKWILTLSLGLTLTLTLGGIYYMREKGDSFSTEKGSVFLNNTPRPVYLYKRFEELSSLPFYLGRKVPILESQSQDLLYGKVNCPDSEIFITKKDIKPHGFMVVHKRDLSEFSNIFAEKYKPVYDEKTYTIFEGIQ
jgi:4-amino-4-deoxy-L-arabinose transferase-like glycosyltransferase